MTAFKRDYHSGLSDFLRQYAPDFCWCSAHDLLLMLEQVPYFEDIAYDSLKVTLCVLKKEGYFITKKNPVRRQSASRGLAGHLYLRIK